MFDIPFDIVILAAGSGTRTGQDLAKPYLPLGGKSLLQHVYDKACSLQPARIIVVTAPQHASSEWALIDSITTHVVTQASPQGTAHAVQCALAEIRSDYTLILYADVPLTAVEDLQAMVESSITTQTPTLLTAHVEKPGSLGRIVRNSNQEITQICEMRDCSPALLAINEINTGLACYPTAFLRTALPQLSNNNSQGEYYLTDTVALWQQQHQTPCSSIVTRYPEGYLGINTLEDLAYQESLWQQQQIRAFMAKGVRFDKPESVTLRGSNAIAKNCVIGPHVTLENCSIAEHCHIGQGSILTTCQLDSRVQVLPYCVLTQSRFGKGTQIGPFAYCRAETHAHAHSKIGSFVECKKTQLGAYSKASHLAYLGDLVIGEHSNIGAGVIHCNYNGHEKFTSHIGNYAFVGADSQLIGPVRIGDYALLGAGSTLTQDAPPSQLTVSRTPCKTRPLPRRNRQTAPATTATHVDPTSHESV